MARSGIRALVCVVGAVLAAPIAQAAVQKFPEAGAWASVTISGDRDWRRVTDAKGETLVQVTALGGEGHYGDVLVVSNTVDALHVDPRPAFAAGASEVHLYIRDLDPAPLSGNRSVVAKIVWEGASGMKMRDILFARREADGSEWHDGRSFESRNRRKRISEAVYSVPEATRVYHRIDILSPGDARDATGVFKFYGVETGDWSDIGSSRIIRQNKPSLLFAASFDNGFAADCAGGSAQPVKTNGVELTEGRTGRGVRFRRNANSNLAWPVLGNVNPKRGTVAFWFKKEWANETDWRTLFYCPGKDAPGGGTLNFWCLGSTIRLDRHDLDREEQYIYPNWRVLDGGWHYYMITWDEEKTRFYIDGSPTPYHMNEKHNDDYSPMRAALKAVPRYEFARDMKAFKTFCLGSQDGQWAQDGVFDDLRIWSEAMTAEEARQQALRDGAQPFNSERAKARTGANVYEASAQKEPGRPAGLKLVRRIRPAVDAFDKSNFSSVGVLATNQLNGIAYLEAGPRTDDRFAIRMTVDVAKPFYFIEVDYPDDTYRAMELLVQRTQKTYGDYVLETGVFCGDVYRPSGKIRTERYVYWTSSPDIALIAATIAGGAPAAIAEIRLYESTDGRLPAAVPEMKSAPTPRRHFVNYWEDPAIIYDFATDFNDLSTFGDMVDRCAAYMKYCGQDVLAFPACFYGGRIGENGFRTRDLPMGYLEAFMTRFDDEDLSIVPTINQQIIPFPEKLVTRQTMANGALHPTAISIHSTGCPNWGGWHGTPPNFNIAHPDTQKEFLRIVKNLADEGKSHPSFKGVALHIPTLNPLWFGSIEAGYNDYCIEAFEKATGIRVPCDRKDPLRGKAYAEWLKANAYESWVAWRCDVVTDFYARLARTLAAARPDLRLWLNPIPVWSADPDDLADSGYTHKILLEAGFDAQKIAAKVPGAVIGLTGFPVWWQRESLYSERLRSLPDGVRARVQNWSVAPERFAPFRDLPSAWVNLHDVYHETAVGSVRTGKDVLSNDWLDEVRWRVSTQHPTGAHALAPFASALAGCDAQVLSCGGFLIGTQGMEEDLAWFMREYRKLPAVKFNDLPSPKGWVYRTADCDGQRWVYKLKTGYPYTLQVSSEPQSETGKKD